MSGVSDDSSGWEDSDNPDELGSVEKLATMMKESRQASVSKSLEVATFAGGCFWCTEAVFDKWKELVRVNSANFAAMSRIQVTRTSARERRVTLSRFR